MTPILEVRDLVVEVHRGGSRVQPVSGASISLAAGETLGIVGESGSGKTLTALAILGLLPQSATVVSGQILLHGQDLLRLPARERANLRGRVMTLVTQNTLQSLDPLFTLGHQVAEPLTVHKGLSWRSAWNRAVELVAAVGIPAARSRVRNFPFQLSGGMRQRGASAAALGPHPEFLIADEPTTALDVVSQRQYVQMLVELQRQTRLGLIYITHDIALVSGFCDQLAVFYAGRVVEFGPRQRVLDKPAHPYTRALLRAVPYLGKRKERLAVIPGDPADPASLPPGCSFHPRCEFAWEVCRADPPPPALPAGEGQLARCWLLDSGKTTNRAGVGSGS